MESILSLRELILCLGRENYICDIIFWKLIIFVLFIILYFRRKLCQISASIVASYFSTKLNRWKYSIIDWKKLNGIKLETGFIFVFEASLNSLQSSEPSPNFFFTFCKILRRLEIVWVIAKYFTRSFIRVVSLKALVECI